jgi:hypothetical protein
MWHGQISLLVLAFSSVTIIPPLLHIHSISSGEFTEGPLEVQLYRSTVSAIATIASINL